VIQTDFVTIAREHWGADCPSWILALAAECMATSQRQVADKLERSSAMISHVLRNKYSGDVGAIEERFNSVFKGSVVACPALGTIPAHECQDWRVASRTFVSVNPRRVMMFKACGRCERNTKGGAA
jgi:hypothetical protein